MQMACGEKLIHEDEEAEVEDKRKVRSLQFMCNQKGDRKQK